MRWLLLALLAASCGLSIENDPELGPMVRKEPETLSETLQWVREQREERQKDRELGQESKTRPGERCFKIELDDTERWAPDDGFGSERAYLEEACYQSRRFLHEHLWCMYGTTDTFRFPSRMRPSYPCLFSDSYEVRHGLAKRNKNGRLVWPRTR